MTTRKSNGLKVTREKNDNKKDRKEYETKTNVKQ